MSKNFKSKEHKRTTPLSYRPSKEAWARIGEKRKSLKLQGKKATVSQIIEACILASHQPLQSS